MALHKKEFAPLTFPNVNPIRDEAMYMQSKQLVKSNLFEMASDDVMNPSVALSKGRRELNAVKTRLKKIRETSKDTRREMNVQWSAVEEKKELFKTSMINLNSFIKANFEKRDRAEKKIEEERNLQQLRTQMLDSLHDEMNKLMRVKSCFEKNIRNFKVYENYLEKVVDKSAGEYREVAAIIKRNQALQEARVASVSKCANDMTKLEDYNKQMINIIEDNNLVIIGLKNRISDLQLRFGTASKRCLSWESTVEHIKNMCFERQSNIDMIGSVCSQLYDLICSRRLEANRAPDDAHEDQMLYVSNTLTLMAKIIHLVSKGVKRRRRPRSPMKF